MNLTSRQKQILSRIYYQMRATSVQQLPIKALYKLEKVYDYSDLYTDITLFLQQKHKEDIKGYV